jgi:flagellar biosynthesis protein FlhF
MKVKRYTATTMQEAISRIRQDLGTNAVILHSRKVGRGVMNLLGKPVIEVTAAVDEQAAGHRESASAPLDGGGNGAHDAGAGGRLAVSVGSPPREPEPTATTPRAVERPTGVVENIRRRLVRNDVDELLAEALVRSAVEEVRSADSEGLVGEYIEKRVERFLRVTGPIRCEPGKPTIVALVGPTGVGKTTTAAKLAAHFAGAERKRVAILTVAVHSVPAVEQMRVYAAQLRVPIEVVLTPMDLRGAIAGHRDKDLILIDSGGRSPYEWMQVLELASFIKEAEDAQVNLVLSAATRCRENVAAFDRFSSMDIHSLLITKLDETRDYGSLLTLAVKTKRPISYLATGRDIPQDIEPASSAKLARMILRVEATSPFRRQEMPGTNEES